MHSPLLRLSAVLVALAFLGPPVRGQEVPPATDLEIYDIIEASSAERVEADIRTLVGFGTRNTLSDTTSSTRGIGAARRWIKAEMGTVHPDRYVIMSGDIDSRPSDGSDGETDAPGANDIASGMAGVIEAARMLTRYQFPTSVVLVGLSGEEQGLFGSLRGWSSTTTGTESLRWAKAGTRASSSSPTSGSGSGPRYDRERALLQ